LLDEELTAKARRDDVADGIEEEEL